MLLPKRPGRSVCLGLLLGAAPALLAVPEPQPQPQHQPPGRELVQLTTLVRYLRRRAADEAPGPVPTLTEMAARFREELARLDLAPPSADRLDLGTSDLQLAGVILEEQMRRRRSQERSELLGKAQGELSVEVEGLLSDAEHYVPEFAPEIAEIFATLRPPESEARAAAGPLAGDEAAAEPAPEPEPELVPESRDESAAGPAPAAPAAPVAPAATAATAPDHLSAGQEAALAAELASALPPADPAPPAAEAMFFGDRRFVVARTAPAPAPVARRPARPAKAAGKAAVKVAAKAAAKATGSAPRPAPKLAAKAPARPGALERLVARVAPELAGQAGSDDEFASTLRQALSVFGIVVPPAYAPRRSESPAELARGLALALGPAGGRGAETAVAALGL